MLNEQKYVVLSLELHLFFARIMKEHSLFLEAGFTPPNAGFARTADRFKLQFESVLFNAVQLANGIISPASVSSGEIVTEYTLGSEQKTQDFTGIAINKDITRLESNLYGSLNPQITPRLVQQIRNLNSRAKPLIDALIDFKTRILNNVLSCRMFTLNYPLLIEHIRREANLYRSQLTILENGQDPYDSLKETELFWDRIMMEHAWFIRGLLDPSEGALINSANDFADDYSELINKAKAATEQTIDSITDKTLQETIEYRNFKEAGTKGIAECKIRSIILPLLGDHVLREANHYIKLLRTGS